MHTISISICVIGKVKVHLISHPSLTRRGSRRASFHEDPEQFLSNFSRRTRNVHFQACSQTMAYTGCAVLIACVFND